MLIGVKSILVPFEKQGEKLIKRDDLPRFLTAKEVIHYLYYHPTVSWRTVGDRTERVTLNWEERSEPDLIKEYAEGVGTPEFNRKRFGR